MDKKLGKIDFSQLKVDIKNGKTQPILADLLNGRFF